MSRPSDLWFLKNFSRFSCVVWRSERSRPALWEKYYCVKVEVLLQTRKSTKMKALKCTKVKEVKMNFYLQ